MLAMTYTRTADWIAAALLGLPLLLGALVIAVALFSGTPVPAILWASTAGLAIFAAMAWHWGAPTRNSRAARRALPTAATSHRATAPTSRSTSRPIAR